MISLRGVSKTFAARGEPVHALTGVDLDLRRGETLGLVGESGSGKTTLARVLLGLTAPDEGSTLELEGRKLAPAAPRRSRDQLRAMQIVFQNPDSALNRRHSVRYLISRALTKLAGVSGQKREEALLDVLHSVRMEQRHLGLRPAQLSGGLKQRVAIARAFAGEPKLVVDHEPTSALDVVAQRSLMVQIKELQQELGFAVIFVTHDMSLVSHFSDRLLVMYAGQVAEIGVTKNVFDTPRHPYSIGLMEAFPSIKGERVPLTGIPGRPPDLSRRQQGCWFAPRCPKVMTVCTETNPDLYPVRDALGRCLLYPAGADGAGADGARVDGAGADGKAAGD